ncbi:transport integral membrane protein [Streptomyces albiflavescens]|uniref:Protein YobA n=1 Tax=Streptomyces albiflavescens TaxID=1623582 RepID=A0A917Y628_9ACTN|nr:copper resistance protein CopC [Streptomyces albiflavescens]GGN67069.1 transport integral membrane protein [Streptomyces albiflavescens]
MSGQRDRRRIVRGLGLIIGVLVLVLFGGVGGASAHAALTGTDPQDGSVLKSAPRQITLTFSESVGLLDDSFRVLTPENRRVHTGRPEHAGDRSSTARVTLPRGLGTGTFTVVWRVVSGDSHPVSGAFTFSIGQPSATTAAVPTARAADAASATLYDIARYVAYGGLALLIGAGVFVLASGYPGSVRRLLQTGWWTLLLSTLALLLLRGPYERGTGVASALDPAALRETLTSKPGVVLVARLVLLVAAAFLPERVRVRERGQARAVLALGGVLALALAVTWAAAEHASAGIQVPVAMVSSVLHLLAMAVWLGGLTALLTALHRPGEPLPTAVVTRFSRLALASVAVLAATGVYQSWRGLGSWDALTSTSYGRLLLVKLGGVLLLLAGAAYSRRWTGRLVVAEAAVPATVPAERVAVPVGGPAVAETAAPEDVSADATPGPGSGSDSDPRSGSRSGSDPRSGSGSESGSGAGDPAAYRRALRRSVLAEVTVGIVVLVITTLLTGTQPGRAAEETAAASTAAPGQPTSSTTLVPFDVGTPGGHGKVQIELTPGRVGENSVQAVILGPDGGIATVPELRLTFTLAAQKVGPLDAELTDKGGYWGTDGLTLPLAGTWTMNVTVRTSDIDQVTVSKTVKIG